MTTKKNPTNTDIYQALGGLNEKVDAIHDQVKRTNGRVTALEQKEQKRSDIEDYIEKQGFKTPAEVKEGWTSREKTLTAIITALLAIVTALVGIGKI